MKVQNSVDIDELYERVEGFDLVLTVDAPLADALNNKIEFRGCTPEDLDTIKINATVRKFHSCNCKVKRTVGSRKEWGSISRNNPRRKVERCISQGEDSTIYHDSKCKEGTKKEHYYLQCNNRLR